MNPAEELKKIADELEETIHPLTLLPKGWHELKKMQTQKDYETWVKATVDDDVQDFEYEYEVSFVNFEGKWGDTGKILKTLPDGVALSKIHPVPWHSSIKGKWIDEKVDGYLTSDGQFAYIDSDEYSGLLG